jgi:PAS domain S-box-containing protein
MSSGHAATREIIFFLCRCSAFKDRRSFVTVVINNKARNVMHEEAAEKLRELEFAIEAAELGTWSLNPATGKFRGNTTLKEWFGLSPEEEISLSLAISSIDEKDRERVQLAIALAIDSQSSSRYDIIYTILHPVTGIPRVVHAKGKAWFTSDNICYRFNGTIQDITKAVDANRKILESEAKYRDLFVAMDQGFCILEMIMDENAEPIDYVFLELNPVFELQTGLKNAIGKTARALVPGLEKQWFEMYGKVAVTGEAIRFNQGSEAMGRWFEVYAYRTGAPEDLRVALLFTDITAKKLADIALERSEQNLRSMLLQAPVAICIFRGENMVVEIANEKMLQLFGRSASQVINKPVSEAMPELKNQSYKEMLQKVLESGEAFSANDLPVSFLRKGVIRPVFIDLLYQPLREANGTISGVLVVAHDVTEKVIARKAIEESEANLQERVKQRTEELAEINTVLLQTNDDLAQSNKDLQILNDQLAQYAYVASHDLQEPLRKIRTFSSILELMPDMSQKALTYIHKVTGSAERMTDLIKDLLEFSRLSESTVQMKAVNLNDVIKAVVRDFELVIKEKSALVQYDLLPVIEAVPLQMNQLFYNLIGNALKFTAEGRNPEVTISTSFLDGQQAARFVSQPLQATDYYLINIKDNGIGFETQYADQIFEVFKRLHGRHQFPGSGIGLSLCKKIVELHHGHLSAGSTIEMGSVFQIILPARQAAKVL